MPLSARKSCVLLSLLGLTSMTEPASPPDTLRKATGAGTCFNFANVSTFKTLDGGTVRVSVRDVGEYDIGLGPECQGLDARKEISIQSAPIGSMCPGPQTGQRWLTFKDPASTTPLRCTIIGLQRVASETAKPKN